ncbi:MAG: pseudouridine synthase, partial [Syntrophomonadaceae bacterium]|nr:pseudouridine synthase [Syntrophomonadaceae bacterium]
MRLAKYLADAGITSRRKAEQLIMDKRVAVNGQIVDQLACNITPETDRVEVDGRQISLADKVYLMINKPAGVLSSVSDPHGRPTIIDLLTDIPQRIYPIGRLDLDTEGLLLLTNDGDFTNLMIHPRHEINKTYQAWVEGVVNQDTVKILSEGVMLDDGITAPAGVSCL